MNWLKAFGACTASANSKPAPWTPETLDSWMDNGTRALINCCMASAERSFHKSSRPYKSYNTLVASFRKKRLLSWQPSKMGYFPEDMEEYVESIVNSRMNLLHSIEKDA